jgi:hypothetical protein
LEQLIENPKDFDSNLESSLQIVKMHDEIATKLPKDISKKNIIVYGEKLRNMKKSNPDLDFSK